MSEQMNEHTEEHIEENQGESKAESNAESKAAAIAAPVKVWKIIITLVMLLVFTWYDTNMLFFALRTYKPDVLIGYNSTIASINKAGSMSTILKSIDRIIVGGGLLTSSQKANLFEIAQNSGKKISVCSVTGCDEILTYAYGPSDLDSDRLLGFPLPGVL